MKAVGPPHLVAYVRATLDAEMIAQDCHGAIEARIECSIDGVHWTSVDEMLAGDREHLYASLKRMAASS